MVEKPNNKKQKMKVTVVGAGAVGS
ncbi:uncharacterized protein METZ01_LOCUS489352, partial [marine metagenome]